MAVDLDYEQVIARVYDDINNALRTTTTAIISGVTQEVIISHTNDSIRLGNGTVFFTSNTLGLRTGLDVSVIDGNFVQSGLSRELKQSVITVTDVPTALPPAAIFKRNTISIRIWGSATVYVGDNTVTVADGYPKKQFEEIIVGATDDPDVKIYAICAPGQSCEARILEIA